MNPNQIPCAKCRKPDLCWPRRECQDKAAAAPAAPATHDDLPQKNYAVYVCWNADHECGDRPTSWCADCPKRAAAPAAPAQSAPTAVLVQDLANDLGVPPLSVCAALRRLGFGDFSVNMAVTDNMAREVRRHLEAAAPSAPEQPAYEPLRRADGTTFIDDLLLQAARQPAGPVAWIAPDDSLRLDEGQGEPPFDDWRPLYTAAAPPPPQPQPLTDGYVQPVPDKCDRITWRGMYYSLPPTARPQPLTDEQVWKNVEVMSCNAKAGLLMSDLMRLVRAVERAHGIAAQQEQP
jgi:hypothetical protein